MDHYANLIAGQWVDHDEVILNYNPSDLSDTIGLYSVATTEDVEEAIAAADLAFPSWASTLPETRASILNSVSVRLIAEEERLGTLLARELGKTLREARGEVVRAGRVFAFFSGEALRNPGVLLPANRPGITVEVVRKPIGVVGLIAPWNFPMAIPAWKIAAALAYGNAVVFKPAELVPGSAWELTRIIFECGIPPGVINLVMGVGPSVGSIIVDSPTVKALSFTGSTPVGQHIMQQSILTGKKLQVEMGGKNALVITDDADLDNAIECSLDGSFSSAGQRCTASSRLIVMSSIHDRFIDGLVKRVRELRVGNALDAETQVGPIVSEAQLEKNLSYIDIGKAEGSWLATGGQRITCSTEGYYMTPALFIGANSAMRISQEEIFGPIASVIRVDSFDEAISTSNDSPYGLSAGICTNSLARASHFRKNVQAGVVTVNLPTAGIDYHVPFGGTKASSYGPPEQGTFAREFFTKVQTNYVNSLD